MNKYMDKYIEIYLNTSLVCVCVYIYIYIYICKL